MTDEQQLEEFLSGLGGDDAARKMDVVAFFKRFPDDDTCLEHVMRVRHGMRRDCPKCGVVDATFHRSKARKCFGCAHCGHAIYPCAGTVLERTRTPLQLWFYAIYLFVVTRHGVSGKELERALGVHYETAWRMGHQIRQLMRKADAHVPITGHVEVDETYVGGRRKGGKRGRGAPGKTIVAGVLERGKRIEAVVVPDVSRVTLTKVIKDRVAAGATISTDELPSYNKLRDEGYRHGQVNHGTKEYAWYDYQAELNHHVNGVENFWKIFKSSVRSTHVHVSSKYMQRYLDEFGFRMNQRRLGNAMFDRLVAAF